MSARDGGTWGVGESHHFLARIFVVVAGGRCGWQVADGRWQEAPLGPWRFLIGHRATVIKNAKCSPALTSSLLVASSLKAPI